MRVRIAIFDLDGTLTRTTAVDDRCYHQALLDIFPELTAGEKPDWARFPQVTDSGILAALVVEMLGRTVTESESARVEAAFMRRLAAAAESEPESFIEMAGARALLRRLEEHPRWEPWIATGSWRASALLKLETAGIDWPADRLCTATEAVSRHDIFRRALAGALTRASAAGRDAERVAVLVGDRPWDESTAAALGMGFVARCDSNTAVGADGWRPSATIADWRDPDRALRLLDREAVPF